MRALIRMMAKHARKMRLSVTRMCKREYRTSAKPVTMLIQPTDLRTSERVGASTKWFRMCEIAMTIVPNVLMRMVLFRCKEENICRFRSFD